ncbi:hypothetical protein CLU79DRAFT_740087 [Phycomyces nitens]|nr:hypothetical protein CLU79DRAFT_740087 [Phycomyces nitens]
MIKENHKFTMVIISSISCILFIHKHFNREVDIVEFLDFYNSEFNLDFKKGKHILRVLF